MLSAAPPEALVCASAARVLSALAWFASCPRLAHGEEVVDTQPNAFACMGEAEAFVKRHDAAQMRAERDRLLTRRAEFGEPAAVTAHRWCVVAELMRSLGDDRAPELYGGITTLHSGPKDHPYLLLPAVPASSTSK